MKLLQSEGSLSIASTGKDPATGKLVTHQYRVEGPVMMFLTTTAIDIEEELLNRCVVLSVNEDREQTKAIHRLQREQQTLAGLLKRQRRKQLIRLHQNAQRLLKPLFVVNPFVDELTFPDAVSYTHLDVYKRQEAARRGTDRAVPIQPQLRCDGTGVCHLAKLSRRRQCFEH